MFTDLIRGSCVYIDGMFCLSPFKALFELSIERDEVLYHNNVTCSHHELADKLLIWPLTIITHSLTDTKIGAPPLIKVKSRITLYILATMATNN